MSTLIITGGTDPFPGTGSSISSYDIYTAAHNAGRTAWTYAANSWQGREVYDSSGRTAYIVPSAVNWNFFRGKYAGFSYYYCNGGEGGGGGVFVCPGGGGGGGCGARCPLGDGCPGGGEDSGGP